MVLASGIRHDLLASLNGERVLKKTDDRLVEHRMECTAVEAGSAGADFWCFLRQKRIARSQEVKVACIFYDMVFRQLGQGSAHCFCVPGMG